MRVEIDQATEQKLEQIRREEWRISGKGHSDTVRFLASFYLQHESLRKLLEEQLQQIPGLMEQGVRNALRDALLNLIQARSE